MKNEEHREVLSPKPPDNPQRKNLPDPILAGRFMNAVRQWRMEHPKELQDNTQGDQMTESPSVILTANSLARVGVELFDERNVRLKCKTCGQVWSPHIQVGGRMPSNWWKCPNDPEHTRPMEEG
jgi:hypothetical protein